MGEEPDNDASPIEAYRRAERGQLTDNKTSVFMRAEEPEVCLQTKRCARTGRIKICSILAG